jgi:hypothetical protein
MSKIQSALRFLKEDRGAFMAAIVQNFFRWLPDKPYLQLLYRFKMGHRLDLKNPKTFTEKLQWLKLYNRRPEYTNMVDKYAVKKYVADIIGEEYIIPTLGVWDKPENINWDSLPNQFVLKTTHGGGGGGVVICKDKQTFNRTDAIAKLNQSMRSDIYSGLREWPYKNVPHRIIAEKFIAPEKGQQDLIDYKIYCFNGEPKLIMTADGRFSGDKRFGYYDINWKAVDITWGAPRPDKELPRPAQLQQMLKVAAQLSKGIPHVRIDLYNVAGDVMFGEITMFDSSGLEAITPDDMDSYLGSLIRLPKVTLGGGKILIFNNEIIKIEQESPSADLKDYKFFCFNGKVKCFKIDFGRFVEHHANYYSPEGQLLPFGEKGLEPDPNHIEIMPENLNEMISIVEKLSEGFKFLRVDLYNIKGKIYFGELTFYPASGMLPFVPEEWDEKLGSLLIVK